MNQPTAAAGEEVPTTEIGSLGGFGLAARVSRHVLVVDDEASVLTIMSLALGTIGCTVMVASSAKEGLRIAGNRAEQPVDLLITDLRMPDMGGKEFAGEFLKLVPRAKVIFMSGMPRQSAIERAGLDQTDLFLAKPVRIAALKETIDGLA